MVPSVISLKNWGKFKSNAKLTDKILGNTLLKGRGGGGGGGLLGVKVINQYLLDIIFF